jgi:hypothetical protein
MVDPVEKATFRDNGTELSGYNARDHQRTAEAGYSAGEQQFGYDTSYRGPSH